MAGTRYQRAFPDYLEFIPEVSSAHEFADLSARVACYLGDAGLPLLLAGPRFELRPSWCRTWTRRWCATRVGCLSVPPDRASWSSTS